MHSERTEHHRPQQEQQVSAASSRTPVDQPAASSTDPSSFPAPAASTMPSARAALPSLQTHMYPFSNPMPGRGSKRPPPKKGYRRKAPPARIPHAASVPSPMNSPLPVFHTETMTTTPGPALVNSKSPEFVRAVKRKATSSKKRRRRGGSKSRRTSSNVAGKYTSPKRNMIIVSDEAPDRITNPLIEPLPPRNTVDIVHGAELYYAADLVYHRPDTYPLSYMARLLGFDVPVAAENMKFPMALPDVSTLPLRSAKDDPFMEIPDEESKVRFRQVNSIGQDPDDHMTLDYIDPVYSALLQRGFSTEMLQPCSTNLVTKFFSRQKEQGPLRRNVLKLAQTMLPSWDSDWTFADWTMGKTDNEDTNATNWTIDGKAVFSNPPAQAFGIVASHKGVPKVLLKYQFKWYKISDDKRESELVMTLQGIGQPTTEPVNVREYGISISPAKVDGQGMALTTPDKDPSMAAATTGTIDAMSSNTLNVTSSKLKEDESLALATSPLQQQTTGQEQTMELRTPSAMEESKSPAKFDPEGREKSIDLLPVSDLASDSVILVMFAMALEHTRSCDVWYCLWDAPRNEMGFNKDCFRMSKVPNSSENDDCDPMVCDVKKCSTKFAFLKMYEKSDGQPEAASHSSSSGDAHKERWLVRLPNVDEAKACFDTDAMLAVQRGNRGFNFKPASRVFTGATGKAQEATVGVRAILGAASTKEDGIKLLELENGSPGAELEIPQLTEMESGMEVIKCFPLKAAQDVANEQDNEILRDLKKKQEEVVAAEKALEPRLRLLMSKIIDERLEYERPEARQKRADEERILEEHRKAVEKRKEMDQKLQEQLEQDMNAVCSICGDGEVIPENQILFCEACNEPVHQTCYGIEEVPEGDYYCVACRYFKRDKMIENKIPGARRVPPPVLPIRCELCPVKQGAYIRTETKKGADAQSPAKWVHMACAKWQGLNFVDRSNPVCVEDVSTLRTYFRRMDIACDICRGKRGAYHKCYFEGCEKWMHMSCAMACGMCEVNYGEDVEGQPTEKPWTLMCREHSDVDIEGSGRKAVPIEELVRVAKEFPEEPMPEPPPPKNRVFNKMNGTERARALANPEYEQAFLEELLTKKFAGVRCECCDIEDSGTGLQRCSSCWATVCVSCRLSGAENSAEQKYFKCFSCQYSQQQEREGREFAHPQCDLCYEKGGLLLNAVAKPVGRSSYWKCNPKLFERSIFGRKLWAHYTCAFWSKGMKIKANDCLVDFSDVVMSNGRGYIQGKIPCYLCGNKAGMKTKCFDPECRARGERNRPYYFHVTCARQAGYEVNHNDDSTTDGEFYVYCYEHGGNEYNLRARLEDLIEVERRRSGKKLGKADAPMNFNDASRLLRCSMLVVRILGWAWRWSELWVESDSTWEPLLEPGQKEEEMTKAQLKIVESTPESRCADARRCRLAAFGAALRNRGYDEEEKVDNDSLIRALRAVLSTPSLVGPWKEFEIDFFVDWLARAYRSKSRLLSLGDDKVPIGNADFCFHIDDKSPKYELGSRPLPGKDQLPEGVVFEEKVLEPDDFLKPEMIDGVPVERKRKAGRKKRWSTEGDEKEPLPPQEAPKKQGPGRPSSTGSQMEVAASRRGVGRPRSADRTNSSKDSISQFDKSAGLAALIPSAIKKRRAPPPNRTAPKETAASLSPKKESGFPVIEAEVPFEQLTQDGPLRPSRRGRPPRVLKLNLVVSIGNRLFNPFLEGEIGARTSTGDEGRVGHSAVDSTVNRDVEDDLPNQQSDSLPRSAETTKEPERESVLEHGNAHSISRRPRKRKAEEVAEVVEGRSQRLRHPPRTKRKGADSGVMESRKEGVSLSVEESSADSEVSEVSEVDAETSEVEEEEEDVTVRRGRERRLQTPNASKRVKRRRTPVTYAESTSDNESEFDEEPEAKVVIKRKERPPKRKKTAKERAPKKIGATRQKNTKKPSPKRPTKDSPKKAPTGPPKVVAKTEASVADDGGYGTDASVPLSTVFSQSKRVSNEGKPDEQSTNATPEARKGDREMIQMRWDAVYTVTKPARLEGRKEAAKFVLKY